MLEEDGIDGLVAVVFFAGGSGSLVLDFRIFSIVPSKRGCIALLDDFIGLTGARRGGACASFSMDRLGFLYRIGDDIGAARTCLECSDFRGVLGYGSTYSSALFGR